jgi:hypothetical protein
MRHLIVFGVAAGLCAGAAHAVPTVQIRGVAARVAIIPEARSDIRVTVLRTNPRLPLHIRRIGGKILIAGDVSRRVHSCDAPTTPGAISLKSRGDIPIASLPWLVIRTPLDVRLEAGDAVFGVIGRSASLDFTNLGCGDWTIADVRGRMRIDQAGAGHTRTGSAGSADLAVAGSGQVDVRAVGQGLAAVSSGSGDIDVARVKSGAVDTRIAGTGNIAIAAGQAGPMTASIAGSGDVRMGGSAQSLAASIAGSGDVTVAKVSGRVTRQIFGPGQVRTGP